MTKEEEQKVLEESLVSHRLIMKALRRMIRDPSKLCSWCMNESVHQTPEGLMLCEECDKEYINEHTKTTLG